MGFMSSKAAGGVMSFLTKGTGSKAIAYVVIIWVLGACVALLTSLLPEMLPRDIFGMLPSYFYYFLNLFMVPAYISTRLSVLVTRWFIRKIPIIGG